MLLASDPSLEPASTGYWRKLSHASSGTHLMALLRFDPDLGGLGTMLYSIDKQTEEVSFRPLPIKTTLEQCYWSAGRPAEIYVPSWSALKRLNVETGQWRVVFQLSDHASLFGPIRPYCWQAHSSADDRVHSATIRDEATEAKVGTFVFVEDGNDNPYYFPAMGVLDESQVSKCGKWLLIIETRDGSEDNRIIDLTTGEERIILDRDGAAGHHDMGFGQMIAADNFALEPNTWKLWDLSAPELVGRKVYSGGDWEHFAPSHVSWCNAPQRFVVGYAERGDETMVMPLDGGAVTRIPTRGIEHGSVCSRGEWFLYSNLANEAHLVRLPTAGVTERRAGPRRLGLYDRRRSVSAGPDSRSVRRYERGGAQ